MSSIDQFTINYKVDANAAVSVLEKLNKTTAETNKRLSDTGKGLSHFASDATQEMSRLVPQLNEVAVAVRAIGAGFTVATAGALAFAAVAKSAAFARDFFNSQRVDAREGGMGGLALYDTQKKLMGGRGNVSREQASAAIVNAQGLLNEVRASAGQSERSKTLGLMGAFPRVGTTNRDFMANLATQFAGMDESKAVAFGTRLGFNKDAVLNMRDRGANFGKPALNQKDIDEYKKGESATADLNSKLATFNAEMTKLGITLGGNFLPLFTQFVERVNKAFTETPEEHKFNLRLQNLREIQKGKGFMQRYRDADADNAEADRRTAAQLEQEKLQRESAQKSKDAADTNAESVAKQIDKDSENYEAMQDFNAKLMQAVQAFATSVNQFTGVTDERHAWAIWAGTAGAAALGRNDTFPRGTGSATYDSRRADANLSGTTGNGSGAHDAIIKAAAAKYGVPEWQIRGIIGTESSWNPNADNGTAAGLMGINRSNWKAYGLNDSNWRDPAANINAGAAILADMRKRAGGNDDLALRYYHGGFDQSKWGPLNAAYPGKVAANSGYLSIGGPRATAVDPTARSPFDFQNPHTVSMSGPYTKEQARLRSVRERVAAGLGIPVEQVTQGFYRSADAQVVLGNDYAKMLQDRQAMAFGIAGGAGLDWITQRNMQFQLANTDIGLHNLKEGAAQVTREGQAGDRELSLGQTVNISPIININGSQMGPMELSKAIEDHLVPMFHGLANSNATSRAQ